MTCLVLLIAGLTSNISTVTGMQNGIIAVLMNATLLWHAFLCIIEKPRVLFALYAIVHITVAVPIWITCSMMVSKTFL